jgi:flagellar basal-body rod protein FlgG
MQTSLFTAATGMRAQQMYVDNIANNLANVNTTGLKRSRLEFQDLFYNTLVSAGSETATGYRAPTGLQIGSGVRQVATTRNFTQGLPQNTNGRYDIMINGPGFFQITHPTLSQTVYTRAGSFSINANGQLVNSDGYLLNPQITIPANTPDNAVSIGSDGTVTIAPSGSSTTSTTVGKIQLVSFPNSAGLEAIGANLYTQTPASGTPTTGDPGSNAIGDLKQGWLEGSNVDVVQELVNLIIAQRAYEVNSRAIKASDEMLQQTNNVTQ